MARIGIIGAGAIGGWIGARLALAGHCVSILARPGRANAYREGLRLIDGDEDIVASVVASDSADDLGTQDFVVIAVKAFDLSTVAQSMQPLIDEQTIILPMMNGVPWWFTNQPLRSVDPDGRIGAALPIRQVLGGVVHAACRREGSSTIVVQKADHLVLGEITGAVSDRVAGLTALLDGAGIDARPSNDIRRAIWYKLWGNMTMNPISALTLASADRIIAECRDLKIAAMTEAKAIGAAIGCPIDETAEDRLAVAEKLGPFKTSMLQDVEAGRKLELEAILAAPLELARRHQIATPNLDALYALTKLMAQSRGLA